MNRQLILKCLGIFFILILFSIALSMVEFKVDERQSYRAQATRTVAKGWSHDQLIAGPIFELKFKKNYTTTTFNKELKKYVDIAKTKEWSEYHLLNKVTSSAVVNMQERYVGIFKVPVYTSDIILNGQHLAKSLDRDARKNLVSASLLVSISDMRGLASQPTLNWNKQTLVFRPGTQQKLLGNYIQSIIPLTLFDKNADLNIAFTLRGVDKIGFVPTAENVISNLSSSWPHPSFMGNYLPTERQISSQGFNARWEINSFASSIGKALKDCHAETAKCAIQLQQNKFGVQLASAVDVYQMTDRALKYGFLFICLTFVIFCLLELQKRFSIHPIQYGFVGAALAVFYMLVISLSEHIAFGWAYTIGSLACTALICGYLKVVLKSRNLILALSLALLALYSMMFAILQSEDYAFLMGTLLVFSLLAGIMYATRLIDWQQFSTPDALSKDQLTTDPITNTSNSA